MNAKNWRACQDVWEVQAAISPPVYQAYMDTGSTRDKSGAVTAINKDTASSHEHAAHQTASDFFRCRFDR